MQAKSVARSSKPPINLSFTTKFDSPFASKEQPPLFKEDVKLDYFHPGKTKPQSFWKEPKNQKHFFQYVANQLAITKVEDWSKVELKHITQLGGFELLRQYGGSVPLAIASLFPNAGLEAWQYSKVPRGYWDSMENQRRFFEWLAQKLNITSYNDWYQVSAKTITEYGGGGLLAKKYDSSVRKAIIAVFPEHHWIVWRFQARVPDGYWDHEENVSSFLKWCVEQFELKHPTDWLQITRDQIIMAGGKTLLTKFGGMIPILSKFYPQIDWTAQLQKLRSAKLPSSKTQQILIKSIRQLFPSLDIRTNYRHSELVFKNTNREMELDAFIPQLSLAFEYQGPQHYEWTTLSPEVQQQRDEEKKTTCAKLGITLIEIPFWWDRSTSSVAATVLKHRPDAASYFGSNLMKHAEAIPSEMPKRVKLMLKKTQSNRILMSEVKKWNKELNPAECLICHQVEGIRVLWDGDSILRTQDDIINAPTTFLESLPRMPLDGIITFGKGGIQQWWQALTNKSDEVDPLWNSCKLYIYDSPQLHQPFEERIQIIEEHLGNQTVKIILMKPHRLNSETELETSLKHAQENGYTGLFIRKSKSLYMDHDSWFVLQKPEQDFAGILKLEGNALTCKLPGRSKFTVDLPNSELKQIIQQQLDRNETPVISIQHQGIHEGAPVKPSFKDLRQDIKWDSLANKYFGTRTAYFLSTGRKGTHPSCRGCKRVLDNKKELRITVKGAFTPLLQSVPVPVNLSVCANTKCIERAAANTGRNSGIFLPPFEHMIAVPEKLSTRLQEAKTKLGDSVEWIEMD